MLFLYVFKFKFILYFLLIVYCTVNITCCPFNTNTCQSCDGPNYSTCMKEVVPIPAPHHYAVQSGMSYLMYIYTIKMVVFSKIYSSWGQNFNCRSPAVLHRIQKHIWVGEAHVIKPCLPPEVQDLCILTLADMAFEFVDDRHGPHWQMRDTSAKQALKTCLFVSSRMRYCTASRLFHTIEIPGATNLGDTLEFREQLRLLNANSSTNSFFFVYSGSIVYITCVQHLHARHWCATWVSLDQISVWHWHATHATACEAR